MSAVVAAALSHLLRLGAGVVLATCASTSSRDFVRAGTHNRKTHRTRQVRSYLPVAVTVEETMDTLGKQTRRNLRPCVRYAARELQATYIPDPMKAITFSEPFELNPIGTHPIAFDELRDRYTRLKQVSGGFLPASPALMENGSV